MSNPKSFRLELSEDTVLETLLRSPRNKIKGELEIGSSLVEMIPEEFTGDEVPSHTHLIDQVLSYEVCMALLGDPKGYTRNETRDAVCAAVGYRAAQSGFNWASSSDKAIWMRSYKGMTEWLPKNGWRTAQGQRPSNLDLFLKLDDALTEHERRGKKIGFWHVAREHNHIADRLAKAAPRAALAVSLMDQLTLQR